MVHDGVGRMVERLLDRTLEAGRHEATWDGAAHASGTYFFVIRVGDVSKSIPVILLK